MQETQDHPEIIYKRTKKRRAIINYLILPLAAFCTL